MIFPFPPSSEKNNEERVGEMFLHLFGFFLLFGFSLAGDPTPECFNDCTDPPCSQICHQFCENPSCEVCHNDTGTPVCSPTLACNIECPIPEEYVSDACPACENVCPGSLCPVDDTHCQILCDAPICSWKCAPPPICPQPVCTQVCDESFCAYAGSSSFMNRPSITLLMGISMIVIGFSHYQ